MAVSSLLPVLLVPLVGWRLYSRYRKLVGKQTPRVGKLRASMLLFPLLLILIGTEAWKDTLSFECLLAGGAAGIALAFWGLKLTSYESGPEGLSYTPNFYIGVGLMLLFTGRMTYRFVQIYSTGGMQDAHSNGFGINPVTTLIVGIVFCYYPMYSSGILRWRRAHALKLENRN
ncbi:hypothetical protein [Undibacterium sp.]|jgi:hypothetical protein|uniref:hypothetical protein n=1 Tax=Undibacterium sp. TaxID=1914977 RepID=UPI002BCD42C5|nr:hypothetical protein [Undibacterium sp.]HTD06194.1 hypothetical protein [Undibacterium sp.]